MNTVAPRCANCGALIVYGKPDFVREHRKTGVVEVPYCELCMDDIRCAFWDEETMGPFISNLHRRGGHA